MAGFFWVIAVLSVLGLLISWSGPYAHAQNEQTKQAPAAQNADAEHHVAKEGESESGGWRKYKEKIERNEKLITATSTIFIAGFTVLLAFATFFLWLATRDLVEDAKHNAERQLRAYVFADALEIRKFGTTEPLEGWLFLKNSGATPAYEFERSGKLMYTRFPAAEFPQIEWGGTKGYLAPHGEIFFGPIPLPRALTAVETATVIAGTHAIYLFGKIKYRDAFGHQRGFEFRSYYRGNGAAAGPVLTTQQDSEGNTAD